MKKTEKGRFFALGDLAVYAVLLVLVAVLFVVFVFGGGKGKGIAIEVGGERVYTYLFGEGGKIFSGKEALVSEERDGDTVVVTVYTDGKEGYNVVTIDLKEKTATVTEANCSFKKDCTHMPAVTEKKGAIVCVPHALTVTAIGAEEDFSPSIG